MSSQTLTLPVASSSSSSTCPSILTQRCHYHYHGTTNSLILNCTANSSNIILSLHHRHRRHELRRERPIGLVFAGSEDSEVHGGDAAISVAEDEEQPEPTPEDLEYISQIKRVLELLKRNRDMLFGEVKLTIMIEDPREVERRRLLGIDDSDAPTRDDLVVALEEVNEGRVPRNRVALRMLAEEMASWPNLEAEAPKKTKSGSLYAKATDIGIDPKVAAKRLNIDWDSAAEIEEEEANDDTEVPPAVGYGALYLVTAFPVIIGISVVLILFYNSLQ